MSTLQKGHVGSRFDSSKQERMTENKAALSVVNPYQCYDVGVLCSVWAYSIPLGINIEYLSISNIGWVLTGENDLGLVFGNTLYRVRPSTGELACRLTTFNALK